ncbi:MAG: LamG domain-containing protein [Pirellulales bacterium]|nr:LamG domain-containing protein [Pirellulales bacterium]
MYARVLLLTLAMLAVACAAQADSTTVSTRVKASADDAGQDGSGNVVLTNGSISLSSGTWCGVRFQNLAIPQGAYIISATLTVVAANSTSGANPATVIYGEDEDNATAFAATANNISGRTKTSATASWKITNWTAGTSYQAPDVRALVQEIVNRPGWASGNSLAILLNATSGASRPAVAYDGSSSQAALLSVTYVVVTRPVANRLLFVVTNSSNPSKQEDLRQAFFTDIGYTVTLLKASANQSSYDTYAAANDVAYISEEVKASQIRTKLIQKPLGIINEIPALADDFGIASTSSVSSGNTAVTVTTNEHYVVAPFAVGGLTILSASQDLSWFSGTLAPDAIVLATVAGQSSIIAVEAGGKLNDDTRAAGRRILLPFGGGTFDFAQLNADGLVMVSRAMAWAGGLVGWWKLDDASGTTATDSTVNLAHGTLFDFDFGANGTTGRIDRALAFNGKSNYVSISSQACFQVTQAFSISAWIKVSTWGTGDDVDTILRKGDDGPNNWQLAVEDGHLALALDGKDGSNTAGNTSLTAGRWTFVVGTWDGSYVRLYVDAVLDNTPVARAAPISTDTREVYLGGHSSGDLSEGLFDDVRFYNHALSQLEINQLMGHGSLPGLQILKWVEVR